MLYVTTRDSQDAYTAYRALSENRSPDGGFFVPMKVPTFEEKQIAELGNQSFAHSVAKILNLFFGTQLDGWDIELSIGRYPVKLVSLNGKITVAKTWQNPIYRFDRLVCGLEKTIRQSDQIGKTPSNWLLIASRIAVLFGVYGKLMHDGVIRNRQNLDIAVPSGDLSALMAVWYARKMGLPIGTIVCCCNENNSLWNLLHKGEIRTDTIALQSQTPDCDYTVPTNLERLIFATLGYEESERFAKTCRIGGAYNLDTKQMECLCDGIHVSVIGGKRMASTIPNLFKTTGFVAEPYTALSYSGLTDYRASTGASHHALIISEESPVFSLQFVAQCMNISPVKLKNIVD